MALVNEIEFFIAYPNAFTDSIVGSAVSKLSGEPYVFSRRNPEVTQVTGSYPKRGRQVLMVSGYGVLSSSRELLQSLEADHCVSPAVLSWAVAIEPDEYKRLLEVSEGPPADLSVRGAFIREKQEPSRDFLTYELNDDTSAPMFKAIHANALRLLQKGDFSLLQLAFSRERGSGRERLMVEWGGTVTFQTNGIREPETAMAMYVEAASKYQFYPNRYSPGSLKAHGFSYTLISVYEAQSWSQRLQAGPTG